MKKIFFALTLSLGVLLFILVSFTHTFAVQQLDDPCGEATVETNPDDSGDEFVDCGGSGGGGGGGGSTAPLPGNAPSSDDGTSKRLYSSTGYGTYVRMMSGNSNGNSGEMPVIADIEFPDAYRQIERLSGFSPISALFIRNRVAYGGFPGQSASRKIWTVPESGTYTIDFTSTGSLAAHVEKRGNFAVAVNFYMNINGENIALAGPKSGQSCNFQPYLFTPDTQFSLNGSCTDNRGPYYDASTNYSLSLHKTVTLNAGDQVELYGTIRGWADAESFLGSDDQDMRITFSAGLTTLDVKKIETLTPSVTLTASPASVVSGGTTTLSWSSANVTDCQAYLGWQGTRALSGTESSTLSHDTEYVLGCTGPNGSAEATTTVTVKQPPAAPTGFYAGAGGGGACGSNWINLSWNAVSGATSYVVKEGSRVVYSGTATAVSDTGLAFGSTHDYTVVATNANGTSATASASAAVGAACEVPPANFCPDGTPIPPSGNCANPGGGGQEDLCLNVAGIQSSIPSTMYRDSASGNCYAIDMCINIAGTQSNVPDGMTRDGNGNCTDIDVCSNISGAQKNVPNGMVVVEGACKIAFTPGENSGTNPTFTWEAPEGGSCVVIRLEDGLTTPVAAAGVNTTIVLPIATPSSTYQLNCGGLVSEPVVVLREQKKPIFIEF